MVDVYRDRQANGTAFNIVFKDKMISRYQKKQNESANQGGEQEHEQPAPESRVVMVYSNFNMKKFMAHATTGTSAAGGVEARAERQQGNDDDV